MLNFGFDAVFLLEGLSKKVLLLFFTISDLFCVFQSCGLIILDQSAVSQPMTHTPYFIYFFFLSPISLDENRAYTYQFHIN